MAPPTAVAPAERVACVLHDLFDVPCDEIAPIVGRTPGASREVCGAAVVAETFVGWRTRVARPALVDGAVGTVWTVGGRPRVVFEFAIAQGKIVQIDLVADPGRLGELDLTILDG